MVALALLIGALGAAGGVGFHLAIDAATSLFRGHTGALGRVGIPLALVAGGVVLLGLERLFPGDVLGYGFPRFLEMLHLQGARVKRRWALLKTVGAAVSLGAGAAVGREGPIAQIGGSIAAAVAGLGRRSIDERKVLIACGAAAGIAATFNAPIGAVLFAQEIVLLGEAELGHLSLVVVASATAVATTRGLFGSEPALHVMPFALKSYWECVTYGALGVLLGLLGVGYVRLFHAALRRARQLPWPRPVTLLGGLALVGLLAVAVPQNLADGYPVINDALAGRLAWQMAAVLAVAKVLGSILSLACGAPGGVFGPIFFIGAMTGASFRALSAWLLPHLTGPLGSYALVGLGGFLAATTRAPLTALFLLLEMTDNYSITVPALLAVGLALLVAQQLEPDSIDTYGLSAEGKDLHGLHTRDLLERMTIDTAYRRDVETLLEGARLPEVLHTIGEGQGTALPVVDAAGQLVGVVSFAALRTALAEDGLNLPLVARDLCDSYVPTVTPETSLGEAFRRMETDRVEELPVVDPAAPQRLLGMLSRADLIAAYNRVAATAAAPSLSTWLVGATEAWSRHHRVVTIRVPAQWIGRSLREIDCRGRFGVTVLAMCTGADQHRDYEVPDPDRRLVLGDMLVLAGAADALRSLRSVSSA
jgi:CIC family chloride channel protein